jgi:hypothetical protein
MLCAEPCCQCIARANATRGCVLPCALLSAAFTALCSTSQGRNLDAIWAKGSHSFVLACVTVQYVLTQRLVLSLLTRALSHLRSAITPCHEAMNLCFILRLMCV